MDVEAMEEARRRQEGFYVHGLLVSPQSTGVSLSERFHGMPKQTPVLAKGGPGYGLVEEESNIPAVDAMSNEDILALARGNAQRSLRGAGGFRGFRSWGRGGGRGHPGIRGGRVSVHKRLGDNGPRFTGERSKRGHFQNNPVINRIGFGGRRDNRPYRDHQVPIYNNGSVSEEWLDKELDQYMSQSKPKTIANLDEELDAYMKITRQRAQLALASKGAQEIVNVSKQGDQVQEDVEMESSGD